MEYRLFRESSIVWVACFWADQIGIAVERTRLSLTTDDAVVLSTEDGVILVAADDAARWGVGSKMTVQAARALCPNLVVLPYDREAYCIAARVLWDILAVESSIVEPVSPEVAFVEMQGTESAVTTRVRELAAASSDQLKISVKGGVGRTKFVALQAVQRVSQKKTADNVVVVPQGGEATFLASLPLKLVPDTPYLDHRVRQQIEKLGIKTLGDIWSLPPHRFPKALQRAGYQLQQWAQGFDADPVKPLWPTRSIVVNVNFEKSLDDRSTIENVLHRLTTRIAQQISAGHEYAREITVRVGLEDRTAVQLMERLALPESRIPPIYRAVLRLFQKLQIGQPVASLEIMAGEIAAGSGIQLSLMDETGELPQERKKRLEGMLVHLRSCHGPRAIIPAALLAKARRIHLWTHPLGHRLNELLEKVVTDPDGVPLRYSRRIGRGSAGSYSNRDLGQESKRYHKVLAIHNCWRETRVHDGTLIETEVWRVESDTSDILELCHQGTEWRITASWD